MTWLVTGAWAGCAPYLDSLRQAGDTVVFMQNEADALPEGAVQAEGIVCNGLFLHHPIEQFPHLRYIQMTSAGADRVPLDYIKAHGIRLGTARGVYSVPMAEFALCGVLQLYKQSAFFAQNQAKRVWEKHRDVAELLGKRVCIVGCGSVGNECAKRFAAFGCTVCGVDLYPRKDDLYHEMAPLGQLAQQAALADVLVLTLPLTEQTRHLIDADLLGLLKQNAVIVNIARGGVMDTEALIAALQSGHLGGAVLDVFEQEPLAADSMLWTLPNVIITPHNSFVGQGNAQRLADVIMKNIADWKE